MMTTPFQLDPPSPPTVSAAPPHVPRPGWAPRVIGVALLVVSVIGGLLMVGSLLRVQRSVTDFQRVPTLGGPVLIDRPGAYIVYYEPGGGLLADLMNPGSRGAEMHTVQAIGPDGNAATVTSSPGLTSYSTGGHSGYTIAEIAVDQPGSYRIKTQGQATSYDTLAVGGSIQSLLAIAFFGGLLAIPIALVGLVLLVIGDALRRAHCSSHREYQHDRARAS
jgi:hypothetical protein